MIIRGVTSTNDWMFGSGQNSYFFGQQAILSNVKTKILEWTGDCFFNMQTGIDWKNLLDIGQQNALAIAIKSLTMNCFGVVQVLDYQAVFSGPSRLESVTETLQTIYSPSAVLTVTPPQIGTTP